jgi:cytochrome o ubiquinol oxidase subunit 1
VHGRDEFWEMKQKGIVKKTKKYEDIELPKNTPMGIYLAFFALVFGFAMVWHMWLFVIIGLVGMIACIIIRTFDEDTVYTIPASEVEKMESTL